jgi:hypothetical protein
LGFLRSDLSKVVPIMKRGSIYELSLGDSVPRYVGQTVNPGRRFRNLIDIRRPGSCSPLLKQWLNRHFGEVEMRVIESNVEMDERERHWIRVYRDKGLALFNLQDGGRFKWTDSGQSLRMLMELKQRWEQSNPEPEDVRFLLGMISQTQPRAGKRFHAKMCDQ